MKKLFRRLFRLALVLAVLSAVAVIVANYHIKQKAKELVFDDISLLPENNVGLLLGTVKNLKNGQVNDYFQYRIDAAVELFKAGKIHHIICSGDNHVEGYDEPEDMKQALMAAGVPDSCITLDYAGFRTLDSIIRAFIVFGQNKITVISQKFHNERAIFLARRYSLDAVAYNAKDVDAYFGLRTQLREYLARVKACMDVYILHKQPKFLGKEEKIKVQC